jgi:hypothetical protein
MGLLTTVSSSTPDARIVGFLLLGGVGSGFTFQTTLLAAQAAVPRREMAVVTGVRNFVRLLGSTLALAIAGALVNNALRSSVRTLGLDSADVDRLLDDPTVINNAAFRAKLSEVARNVVIEGYTKGFRRVFYVTVACTCVAWLASVFLIGQHELKRADDDKLKEESKRMVREKKMRKKGGQGQGDMDVEKGEGEGSPSESKRVSEEKGDEKDGAAVPVVEKA